MDSLRHLQYLASCAEIHPLENIDISSIQDKPSVIALWNVCVKLSAIGYSGKNLADMRRHACEHLDKLRPQPENYKLWGRTAKEYIDTADYESALFCFKQILLSNCDKETQFNINLWRCELLLNQNYSFGEELGILMRLVQDMPQERFRLARFMYSDICRALRNAKDYVNLKNVLECCISVCQGPGPEILEEILHKAKLLLAEVCIITYDLTTAKQLLNSLEENVFSIYCRLKLAACEDNYQELENILQTNLTKMTLEESLLVVDILQGQSKLADSCKALMIISEKHCCQSVLIKWAETLYILLQFNSQLDESCEFLNIKAVISRLLMVTTEERALEIIWNFAAEYFNRKNYEQTLDILDNYYLRAAGPLQEERALVLCAKCYILMNDPINAINCTQDLPHSVDLVVITLVAKIQLGKYDRDSVTGLLKNPEKVHDFLDLLLNCQLENIEFVIEEVSGIIIHTDLIHTEQVLKILCTRSTQLSSILKFLDVALDRLDKLEDKEWFFAFSWNKALDLSHSGTFLRAYSFASDRETKLKCLIGAFRLSDFSSDTLKYIYEELNKHEIPEFLTLEICMIKAEIELIRDGNAKIAGVPIHLLANIAELCFRYNYNQGGVQCLEFLLWNSTSDMEKICARLIEAVPEFEKCNLYIQKLSESVTSSSDETEWILSNTWNRGQKALGLNNIKLANSWVNLSCQLAQKIASPLYEKMNFVYEYLLEPLTKNKP